ncbi:Hypothetical protein, putative [Bodo saltans]|uniref:C3H1-type domain-containing protein n=1 Tax=Bodo saltans TaxID=75058 RepID=A0A0S4IYT8_BODSA|nr:Hypothetical protein, putative [Bodo saltans]|eukprot:CUG23919.1 Hypothetical protein, putative [Bodo saltans]
MFILFDCDDNRKFKLMAYEDNDEDVGCDIVQEINHLTMDDLEQVASTTSINSTATSNTEHAALHPLLPTVEPVHTTKAAVQHEVTFTSNSTSASVTFGPAERRRTVTACLSFLSGSCKRDDCRYVHLKPEIRLLPSSVCAYHTEGECKRGEGCRYFHGTIGTLNSLRRQGVVMYNPKTNIPYDEVPEVLEDPKERESHKRQHQQSQWMQPPGFYQPQYMFQQPPPPPPPPMMQMQPMIQPMMMAPQAQQVQYIQVAPNNGMMPMNYMPMMQQPMMMQQPIMMQQPMMMAAPQQMMMVAQPEMQQYYGHYSTLS